MKTAIYYIARYQEADAHSRNFMLPRFQRVTSHGFTRRGIRVDEWFMVRASSYQEAKDRVRGGQGVRQT